MASIICRGGRYRVQVRRKGVRPSCKTFSTEAEAKAWAKQEEQRCDALTSNVLHAPGARPQPYQVAGIYLLFRGLEIRYIGRSVHVYRRMNDHMRTTMDWDSFRIIPCNDSIAAAQLEAKLIDKHRPPLNLQMAEARGKGKRIPSQIIAPDSP